MLQFRGGTHPPNYLERRQQWRLLALVMLLGVIIWVAMEARNPDYYRWLWQAGKGGTSSQERVDTRLAPGASPRLDTFRTASPGPGEQLSEGPPAPQEALDAIRDDEPFHLAEKEAWFGFFRILLSDGDADLANRSIGPTTFIQLFRQPEEYRGQVVEIRGTLRRCEEIAAPENDLGISSYFQAWVFPDDNPSNPIVVYTLTVPTGFPLGLELAEPVNLLGFFFKRWPYAAVDTVRTAPVVLAGELRWTRSSAEPPKPPPVSLGAVVALAATAAMVVVFLSWWRTRRTRRAAVAVPGPAMPESEPDAEPANAGARLRVVFDDEQRQEP